MKNWFTIRMLFIIIKFHIYKKEIVSVIKKENINAIDFPFNEVIRKNYM